jgi:hypothetical protein
MTHNDGHEQQTRVIPRAEWKDTFDAFTRTHLDDELRGATATLELLSPDLGDQLDDRPVRLLGITWDDKSGALDVFFEDIDHLAFQPESIAVIEADDGFLLEIEIVQQEGERELLHVHRREPLAKTTPLPKDRHIG